MKTVFQPYFVGSGNAARAIEQALAVVASDSEFEFKPKVQLKRGEPLPTDLPENAALVVANPHALHAPYLLEAYDKGFKWAFCEKPAAVSHEQIAELRRIKEMKVAVFHGYRQLWGPQQMAAILKSGEIGKLISVEGRYWHSSIASKVHNQVPAYKNDWKNDPAISGPTDVLLDLSTHWVDLMQFIAGEKVERADVWMSYELAPAEHRDTYNQVSLQFESGARSIASISKIMHGSGNDLFVKVLGSEGSLEWNFVEPDVVWVGRGSELRKTQKTARDLSPPHHSMGWVEGYARTIKACLEGESYCDLETELQVVDLLLSAK